MNKELIKQYKAEFDHWLAGGNILFKYELSDREWISRANNHNWDPSSTNPVYIINDEYVEFRMALAEGIAIQVIASKDVWVDFEIGTSFYQIPENYRIKPKEPQFTYPMWFKSLSTAEVWKFTAITQGHRIDDELYRTHKPHTDKAIWTQIPEPKPTIKIAKYAYSTSNIEWIESNRFFKTDEDFLSKYYIEADFKTFKFKRLTEIEVEDY